MHELKPDFYVTFRQAKSRKLEDLCKIYADDQNNFFMLMLNNAIILLNSVLTGNNNPSNQYALSKAKTVPSDSRILQTQIYKLLREKYLKDNEVLREINVIDVDQNRLHKLIELFNKKKWTKLENYFLEEDYTNIDNQKRVQFLLSSSKYGKTFFILVIHSTISISPEIEQILVSSCSNLWLFLFRNKDLIMKDGILV
ncbi:MAG: hypothetical protein DI598_03285 [Pseudopedobacter saltans]|uniref:Uncharacterized protein n=1 Tax=Pseudopedobacter saltans TaxID=151895 RepID=A0A2W5F946_9SPHI|nr:MAG: hypothetical protein DI598_03285 [Pseudopedobacter saltans]